MSAFDLVENWYNTDYRYYHGTVDPGPMRPAYVHKLDDRLETVDGGGFLELGQHGGASGHELAGLGDILGPLYEGKGDPVRPELDRHGQIPTILFRQGRNRQDHARQINALALREGAAHDHDAIGKISAMFFDAQAQLAVIEQKFRAPLDRPINLGVRQTDARRIAGRVFTIKAEFLPALQGYGPVRKSPDPQFWPLQICQNGHGPTCLLFGRANGLDAGRMILRLAMAKVQTKDIDACIEKGLDRVGGAGGGTEGGHDLGGGL